MNSPILAGQNTLVKLDSGVWVKENQAERSFIDYTDGSQTEEKVYAQVEVHAGYDSGLRYYAPFLMLLTGGQLKQITQEPMQALPPGTS